MPYLFHVPTSRAKLWLSSFVWGRLYHSASFRCKLHKLNNSANVHYSEHVHTINTCRLDASYILYQHCSTLFETCARSLQCYYCTLASVLWRVCSPLSPSGDQRITFRDDPYFLCGGEAVAGSGSLLGVMGAVSSPWPCWHAAGPARANSAITFQPELTINERRKRVERWTTAAPKC